MKTVEIKKEDILNILGFDTLKKDLQEYEEVCPVCKGLGMIAARNHFGLNNENTGKIDWHDNQSLTFCNNCYNGVVKICKHCGKQLERGWSYCNCEKNAKEMHDKEYEKYLKPIENAKKATQEEIEKSLMFYCHETEEYYYEIDDFVEDIIYHEMEIPPVLWLTDSCKISLDAYNICENACEDLHEDAFENIEDMNELQEFLDKWCEKQIGTTSCYQSNKYIKVEKEWFDEN